MMKDFDFLKRISEADGVPGAEDEVREIIKDELRDFSDEFMYDNLGSLIAVKKGAREDLKVSIVGHMDEVGFVVRSIDSKGFLRVFPLGGWNPHMVIASKVTVTSYERKKFTGVMITDKSTKDISFDDIYVDLGVSSDKEVEKFGIRPGDMVTLAREVEVMNGTKNILGKAWDDRIGCATMVSVLKELKDVKHNNTVYGVGSVQEEVGTRGGKTTTAVVRPDLAIIVDVASTKDTPALRGKGRKLNEGPCLVVCDKLAIGNKKLLNLFVDIAKEEKIDFQYDILSGGGTDSGAVHLYEDGIPSLSVVIPVRYAHTGTTIVNYDDYQKAVKLVVKVVQKLDREFLNELYAYKK
ncbi:MAG: M42 family metallopeptidase [Sarcina sp.]